MILPVMTYASEIRGHYIIREAEQLHMNFSKHVLDVHNKVGEYPTDIRSKSRMIGYWSRSTTVCCTVTKLVPFPHTGRNVSLSIYNDCGTSVVWLIQNAANIT